MNRRTFLIGSGLFTVAAATAVWQRKHFLPTSERKALLIAGSSTMKSLNDALKAAYFANHSNVDIVVAQGGSLPGLIALKRGAIDIAAMERDLTVEEDDLQTRNFLIARNTITFITHPSSAVKSLSQAQIQAILRGEITRWSEIGGVEAPIHLISRTPGSNSRQFVEDIVLSGGEISTSATELESTRLLSERVAADPLAFGFVAMKDQKNITGGVSAVKVDAIEATRSTILSGRYPYTQSLYFVLHKAAAGIAEDFIAFAQSAAGQAIVEAQHFVPVYA